jgi:hypothetical protein
MAKKAMALGIQKELSSRVVLQLILVKMRPTVALMTLAALIWDPP